jgi:hypothetical protein
MAGTFRTPAHGTRVPLSESESVAAQIAAAEQAAQNAEATNLQLVLAAITEIKGDVKEHGTQLNAALVKMAEMDGSTRVMSQSIETISKNTDHLDERITDVDNSVRELGNKMASYERGAGTTGPRAAVRSPAEPREGGDRVTIGGAVKLIGAIFSGIGILIAAFYAGHSHGASTEKENQASHSSPTAGHTPP